MNAAINKKKIKDIIKLESLITCYTLMSNENIDSLLVSFTFAARN